MLLWQVWVFFAPAFEPTAERKVLGLAALAATLGVVGVSFGYWIVLPRALDWLTNYGACRLAGGLDLLSKLLGKPGKMEVSGDQVYAMYLAGRRQQVNDYCLFDTLDTYFVFLRTRVMIGEFTLEREQDLIRRARYFLTEKLPEFPALRQYLDNWGDWQPWP